jgi:hypothetical protein
MWPIDGVIGENGGLHFRRDNRQGVVRRYWHEDDSRAVRAVAAGRLAEVGRRVLDAARLRDLRTTSRFA